MRALVREWFACTVGRIAHVFVMVGGVLDTVAERLDELPNYSPLAGDPEGWIQVGFCDGTARCPAHPELHEPHDPDAQLSERLTGLLPGERVSARAIASTPVTPSHVGEGALAFRFVEGGDR